MNQPNNDIPEGFVPFPDPGGFISLIGPLYVKPSETDAIFGFRVVEKHVNPVGICHGGMLMAVADMAIGFIALKASKRMAFPPSINNTFDFLAPAKLGDWLETRIPFVKATGSMAFADGLMSVGDTPVLRFNGICKLPKETDVRFANNPTFEKMRQSFEE